MNTQVMERPLTKSATVTVQNVYPARGPRKSGSIKDVDGQFFGVWPNMLNQFAPGGTYDIEFTEKVANGTVYRDVKTATRAVEPQTFRAPVARPTQTPQQQRSTAPATPQTNGRKMDQQNGNGNGHYRPTHPRDARRMFITKILGDLISTGRIRDDVESMVRAVNDLCEVWSQSAISQDDYPSAD